MLHIVLRWKRDVMKKYNILISLDKKGNFSRRKKYERIFQLLHLSTTTFSSLANYIHKK